MNSSPRCFLARSAVAGILWLITRPVLAEVPSFEVDDLFLQNAPVFEQGRFGQAVRNPIGGHESLFLWYPNVLPETGTLSCWVKPEVGLGCGPLFCNPFLHVITYVTHRGRPDYGLVVNPDRLTIGIKRERPGTEQRVDFGIGTPLEFGAWNHLAVTFTPEETRVYINGALAGKGPGTTLPRRQDLGFLELVTDTIRMHQPGLLDEFILFNRVLAPEEINALYRRTAPYPPGEDTIAIWRFDGDVKLRLTQRSSASGGSLFYRTGSTYSLFRDEKGVAIKFNVINWNAEPADWTVKLTVHDMRRQPVYAQVIPIKLRGRSQREWVQKFKGLPNGMFYGTWELLAQEGTVLDLQGSIFGKTLAPDRMKIPEDARFQVGAEASTYCCWPDNGMTFSLMRQSNWGDVEPKPGQWDWEVLDAFVTQARVNNIHFVLGSASCPPWAIKDGYEWRQGNWLMVPRDPEDFSTYVETLARRYHGRAGHFEVCNEPGYLSPDAYADFVIRAKNAIRKAGADIKVIANWHSSQQWVDQVITKAKDSIDILSTHPYPCLTLENERDVYRFYLGILPHLRALGFSGAWWATEAGSWGGHLRPDGYPMSREDELRYREQYPGGRNMALEYFNSQEDLASMATRSMLVSFAAGVERYSWHYYRALSTHDCIPGYHLLAFGNIAGLLTGGEFVRQLDLGGSDLWAFQFRNRGQTVVAFWQAAQVEAPRKAYFKVGRKTFTITDLYGNSREYRTLDGGVAEVEVTAVPQFLRTPVRDIAVGQPVLTLLTDGIIMPGVASKVVTRVYNPLRKPFSGAISLTPPTGAQLEPADFVVTARPDEERVFESTLLIPVGLGLMHREVTATLTADRLGRVERSLALDVRQSTSCDRLRAAVQIDGDLAEWSDAPAIELNRKSQVILGSVRPEGDPNPALHFEWDGPEDLSGIVRTAWDENNLYLAVRVQDRGRLLNSPREKRIWSNQYDGDCCELFLDFEEQPGRTYGPNTWRIYFVPPTEDFPSVSWYVHQPSSRELEGVQCVGRAEEHGYVIEARIPWSNFAPFKPATGKVIGFDVALDDQDEPEELVHSFGKSFRKCQLGRGENRNFSGDRSQFGRMIPRE